MEMAVNQGSISHHLRGQQLLKRHTFQKLQALCLEAIISPGCHALGWLMHQPHNSM